MVTRTTAVAILTAVSASLAAAPADASQLIGRNAKQVRLVVASSGVAYVSFRSGGKRVRLQASGAVNARTPSPTRPQLAFRLRYGARAAGRNVCRPYEGPELPALVAACRAPDDSFWALQSWQRGLPNYGVRPNARRAAWELRLSHWHGPLAEFTVWPDWLYGGRFQGLFGRLMYGGKPVYGFRTTRSGVPLDGYGRNLYLDTYNSAYGRGWRRENSFLAHRGTGLFCYGFYPRRTSRRTAAVAGNGERYRLTVIGPGVTPDMRWEGEGLPTFDPRNPAHILFDRSTNELRAALLAGDRACRG